MVDVDTKTGAFGTAIERFLRSIAEKDACAFRTFLDPYGPFYAVLPGRREFTRVDDFLDSQKDLFGERGPRIVQELKTIYGGESDDEGAVAGASVMVSVRGSIVYVTLLWIRRPEGWKIRHIQNTVVQYNMYDHSEVFATYLAQTTEKSIFVHRLAGKFGDWNRPLRILDLGAHDGGLTLQYLEALGTRLPTGSTITCVDPSAGSLERFRRKTLPDRFAFRFVPSTAEEFCERTSERFDWAIASHSLYWSVDLAGSLRSVLGLGGRVAIVMREERGIFQVQSRFAKWVGNPQEQLYTADHVAASLDKIGVAYTPESVRSEITIPPLKATAFRALAAFFLQAPPESLDDDALAQIHAFLRERGEPFPHYVRFFWI